MMWIELGIATVAIVVLGLAAWVEASIGSVSKLSIREMLDDRLSRNQESEIEESQHLRSAMLLIQMAMAGVFVALVAYITWRSEVYAGVGVGILGATLGHVIAGRILPGVLTSSDSSESTRAQLVGKILYWVFSPLVWPTNKIVAALERLQARHEDTDEADSLVQSNGNSDADGLSQPSTEIEDEEHEMISGVLQLVRATADDIMVPRLDVVAIPKDSSVAEAVDVAINAGHSRIPVFGNSIDEILGVVYAKDLLMYVTEDHASIKLDDVMRSAFFVPESKRVDDLLQELQQSKVHIAIVVDEYGGTAGVVTIEDILEEIVGEIEDEYDSELPSIEVISEHELLISGRLLVEEMLDEFDLHWEERPQGTVAGLIQRELGRIPKAGDVVEISDIKLTVESVERRRVRQVRCEHQIAESVNLEVADSSVSAKQ